MTRFSEHQYQWVAATHSSTPCCRSKVVLTHAPLLKRSAFGSCALIPAVCLASLAQVTAEMKRKAREERQAVRAEKAAKERKDKEEIFEVGRSLMVQLHQPGAQFEITNLRQDCL